MIDIHLNIQVLFIFTDTSADRSFLICGVYINIVKQITMERKLVNILHFKIENYGTLWVHF